MFQAPSDRSLAVEEASENLITEAVDEEFSADVSLLEERQPALEDVLESEPAESELYDAAKAELEVMKKGWPLASLFLYHSSNLFLQYFISFYFILGKPIYCYVTIWGRRRCCAS